MAAEALATDWRAHLTDTVGFHSGQDAPLETEVLFCIYSGPHEGADFVFNTVMSGDIPLS